MSLPCCAHGAPRQHTQQRMHPGVQARRGEGHEERWDAAQHTQTSSPSTPASALGVSPLPHPRCSQAAHPAVHAPRGAGTQGRGPGGEKGGPLASLLPARSPRMPVPGRQCAVQQCVRQEQHMENGTVHALKEGVEMGGAVEHGSESTPQTSPVVTPKNREREVMGREVEGREVKEKGWRWCKQGDEGRKGHAPSKQQPPARGAAGSGGYGAMVRGSGDSVWSEPTSVVQGDGECEGHAPSKQQPPASGGARSGGYGAMVRGSGDSVWSEPAAVGDGDGECEGHAPSKQQAPASGGARSGGYVAMVRGSGDSLWSEPTAVGDGDGECEGHAPSKQQPPASGGAGSGRYGAVMECLEATEQNLFH
ncbi:unnamed protein product [Closterium sp. Naga37s-1]|nr:unnamed protein product [Closterium sp. Naga37s-1]